MSCSLQAYRRSDLQLSYVFPTGTTFASPDAQFIIYDERGGSALLTVGTSPTPNDSVITFVSNVITVFLGQDDIDALPEADDPESPALLWFDFLLTDGGLTTKIQGGLFRVMPVGSPVCAETSAINVSLDGEEITVNLLSGPSYVVTANASAFGAALILSTTATDALDLLGAANKNLSNIVVPTARGNLEIELPLTQDAATNLAIFQAAHDAAGSTPTTLIVPVGSYPIAKTSGQDYCWLITNPVTLRGVKGKSFLVPDSSVLNTTNIIEVRPNVNFLKDMQEWCDLGIGSITSYYGAGRNGAAGLYFNSQITGSNFSNLKISRMMIAQGADVAILGVGNQAQVPDGAAFCSTIEDNELWGGIDLSLWGDSIRIERNIMRGTGRVRLSTVFGASQLGFVDNNVTVTGGVDVLQARKVFFARNNVENGVVGTGANALSGGAIVHFSGSVGTVHDPVITNNLIAALGSSAATSLLRLGDTFAGYEEDNTLLDGLGTIPADIVVDAAADYFAVGDRHIVNAGTLQLTNNSVTTYNAEYTLTLLNGWLPYASANYNTPLRARMKRDGTVLIEGDITAGTITTATPIAALPTFMAPEKIVVMSVTGTGSAVMQVGVQGTANPSPGEIRVLQFDNNTTASFAGNNTFRSATKGVLVQP